MVGRARSRRSKQRSERPHRRGTGRRATLERAVPGLAPFRPPDRCDRRHPGVALSRPDPRGPALNPGAADKLSRSRRAVRTRSWISPCLQASATFWRQKRYGARIDRSRCDALSLSESERSRAGSTPRFEWLAARRAATGGWLDILGLRLRRRAVPEVRLADCARRARWANDDLLQAMPDSPRRHARSQTPPTERRPDVLWLEWRHSPAFASSISLVCFRAVGHARPRRPVDRSRTPMQEITCATFHRSSEVRALLSTR